MDPRDIHRVPTQALQAPDPSWLEAEDPEPLVQDPRFSHWEETPEQPWEEFSLEHLPQPPAPAPAPVLVRATPVDDTFENAILASGLGAALVITLCLGSAFLGFVIGLLVAA